MSNQPQKNPDEEKPSNVEIERELDPILEDEEEAPSVEIDASANIFSMRLFFN